MNAPVRIDLRDTSTFPTRRDEAWRWSDLSRAAPRPVAPAPEIDAPTSSGPFAGAGEEILFANGRSAAGEVLTLGQGVQALRFVTQAQEAGWQTALEVQVPPGVNAVLLESYEGQGAYTSSVELRFTLGEGASLERVVIMEEPAEAVSLSRSTVTLAPAARFAQAVALSGARLQRHETHITHPGEDALIRMDSVYLIGGAGHADLTTVVTHTGGGETSQVCKGVAAGRSRAAFQGKIEVCRGADGTDARLRHDALLLSETAEVNAKPELEIYADDVQCAHGNTVGALDEDALFYIRSRGVPETEARVLLMQAFVGEVVERIAHEGAREAVAAFVERRLEALR